MNRKLGIYQVSEGIINGVVIVRYDYGDMLPYMVGFSHDAEVDVGHFTKLRSGGN